MTAEGHQPGEPEVLLQSRGVSRSYGGFWAVRDVSVEVMPREIVGLIGPNGAGKTTLFNLLSRFIKADAGQIWFNGQRIDRRAPYRAAQLGLVRTFQISRIFSRMTVQENLMFAAPDQIGENLLRAFFHPARSRKREAEIRHRALELINYFRLERVRDDYAGSLSGGQRKLLEMARALMTSPRMILLDEPMAGVNPALKEELLRFILELREQGMTFLVVEHDLEMIMRISDRILVMAGGSVIAQGLPEEIRRNADVIDAYLGRAQ